MERVILRVRGPLDGEGGGADQAKVTGRDVLGNKHRERMEGQGHWVPEACEGSDSRQEAKVGI